MKKIFAALLAGALTSCRAGTLLAFLVLIGVVGIQIVGRMPGMPSPAWTEEVARFALVYLVGFCCGIALLQGDLVNVDMFVAHLSKRTRLSIDRLVDLIVLVFCLMILRGAWDYVVGSIGERARSLDIPMVTIYAVTLLIPISLAFFSLARILGFAPEKVPADHGETT